MMRRFPVAITAILLAIGFLAPSAHAQDPLFGKGVVVDAAAPALPEVWARTWVIADAATGEILAAKRAHKKRAPASTIKMLTALTVLPRLPLDSTYVARKRAVNMYGSRVGLIQGKSYTIEELMNAMMLPSANDAAVALAQANGGIKRTVVQMNELAGELGAANTVARNPSGLDSPGMVSTAYDLTVIARAGLAQPQFADFVKRSRAQFPAKGRQKFKTIYTTNRLLLGNYRGAIGVKTGFTSDAGRTFVGAAQRDGRTLIVALMGVKERSEVAARKLLDWGFANAGQITPVGTLPAVSGSVNVPVTAEGGGAPQLPAEPILPVDTASDAVDMTVVEVPEASTQPLIPVGGWLVLAIAAFASGIVLLRRRAISRARHAAR